ncbi:MAG: hypothetical protein LBF50_03410 [Azoarcus sp.]|jgi:hypothetical protein|nr:hypothetical protein [Azoarcus sp.]
MILFGSVSLFLLSDNEALKVLSALSVLSIGCFSCLGVFRFSRRGISGLLFLISAVFIVYVLVVRNVVTNDVDKYAEYFADNYQCAPTGNDLFNSNDGWVYLSNSVLVRKINRLGYSRDVVYHSGAGILKYGFLYDSDRVIKLKSCHSVQSAGKK